MSILEEFMQKHLYNLLDLEEMLEDVEIDENLRIILEQMVDGLDLVRTFVYGEGTEDE